MKFSLNDFILDKTLGNSIGKRSVIQNLWDNYGEIVRYFINDGKYKTVILKHVKFPKNNKTTTSYIRKEKSYNVECEWYINWGKRVDQLCKIPSCLGFIKGENEIFILLEDLNSSGYPLRKMQLSFPEIKSCIKFLGDFHGKFINQNPVGLWETGTYWHLETRADELENLSDSRLRNCASAIDLKLNNAKYKTIVHGDAKLENFCFSKNSDQVALLDFQYTGGGVGVKDLVYFIGSCLTDSDSAKFENELINHYFSALKSSIDRNMVDVNFYLLEKEWRELFYVAWADFHRFFKGWSPGYWDPDCYSERVTKMVVNSLC